jgi:hypothetical protein
MRCKLKQLHDEATSLARYISKRCEAQHQAAKYHDQSRGNQQEDNKVRRSEETLSSMARPKASSSMKKRCTTSG